MMAEAATAIGDGAPPPSPRSPSGYVSPRYVPIWRSAAACRRRRRCCCCCRRCCFLSIMMVAIDTPRLALTRARLYAGRRPRCRLAHTPPQPGATDCPQRAATLAATVTAAAVTTTLPQRHRLAGHARGGRLMAEPRQRLAEVSEGHLRAPMQCRRGSRNLRPPTSRCRPHLVALWGRPRRTGSNVKIRIFCSVRFFSPLPPTDSPLSTGQDASSSSSFPKPSLRLDNLAVSSRPPPPPPPVLMQYRGRCDGPCACPCPCLRLCLLRWPVRGAAAWLLRAARRN